MAPVRENLVWAPYLRRVPTLSDRQALLAANDHLLTPRDRREISRAIGRIKRRIRAAREATIGPL